MKIPTLTRTRRTPNTPADPTPPAETYLRRPGHLADAGGAYAVLPWGLVKQLPNELQQQLVDVMDALHTAQPEWATATTYQVLPWRRIRVGDLSDRELSWHAITSDVDPATGTLTYIRSDGTTLAGDTVLGHRPGHDPVPHSAGTSPGLRPPLLPAPPESAPITTPTARSQPARIGRAHRLITTRDRLTQLVAHNPEISTSWAESIAATDDAWDATGTWRTLASLDEPGTTIQTLTAAAPPSPTEGDVPSPQVKANGDRVGQSAGAVDQPASSDTSASPRLWKPEPEDYGLAELDAELRDLVGDLSTEPDSDAAKDEPS